MEWKPGIFNVWSSEGVYKGSVEVTSIQDGTMWLAGGVVGLIKGDIIQPVPDGPGIAYWSKEPPDKSAI